MHAPDALAAQMLAEAQRIHEEDEEQCKRIGIAGSEIMPNAAMVLTHCNTGSLATGGDGTALSVIKVAWQTHKLKHVYVDETRPLLHGARLTAWELQHLGIPFTLITDSTAAFLLQQGKVNAVIDGADRITANGDVANKIGTYQVAVLARENKIPFYVAAPLSTIDLRIKNGKEIPVEEREGREICCVGDRLIGPEGVKAFNPAFDITPARYVRGTYLNWPLYRGLCEAEPAPALRKSLLKNSEVLVNRRT